jgi:hypothetical protein
VIFFYSVILWSYISWSSYVALNMMCRTGCCQLLTKWPLSLWNRNILIFIINHNSHSENIFI